MQHKIQFLFTAPNEDGQSPYCHTHSEWQVVIEAEGGGFALF